MTEPDHYVPPELPDDSVLSLSEYLDMFDAVSHELRYRLLRALLDAEQLSARQLGERVDAPSNKLHYHLDVLESAGLVANRKRNEQDAEGFYSYYVPTSLGETVMEGVGRLLEAEHARQHEEDDVDHEASASDHRVRPPAGVEGDVSRT